MDNDTQRMTFEELMGVPSDTKAYTALDLQSMQQHMGTLLNYIEETRAMHADDTTVDELMAMIKKTQRALREAEVDHVAQTHEISDSATGEIHDALDKESNEKLFNDLLSMYTTALKAMKPYLDKTILAMHAAGKLKV